MSVQLCPFFPDDENYPAPLTLAFPTDTRMPQAVVPLFLIHNLAQPFCSNPGCICKQQRQQKSDLLSRLVSGELTLRQEGDV
ncbi:MAG TPA: hypothetical protein VH593_15445 [Ktedonobacteraceae bacterium]|jgi:hypothetical protein